MILSGPFLSAGVARRNEAFHNNEDEPGNRVDKDKGALVVISSVPPVLSLAPPVLSLAIIVYCRLRSLCTFTFRYTTRLPPLGFHLMIQIA
jgi:hypothetical protein